MALESADFITELDASNPPGTDKKKQGDDHLRMIKEVLKNCFPTADKAWYTPTSAAQTVSFSVLSTDMNTTFLVSTAAGQVDVLLPTLTSDDASWECFFLKTTTDVNPILLSPPSGTLQSGDLAGLAKTRRCIPGSRFSALWTGSAWIVSRVPNLPVGTVLPLPHGSTTPVGYELAYGQTLSSAAVYPDFFSRNGSGVVADMRGRGFFGKDDMGGVAAARLTNALSGIVGTTLGASGGAESVVMAQVNLPNVNFTVTIPAGEGSHSHTDTAREQNSGLSGLGVLYLTTSHGTDVSITAAQTLPQMSGTAASGGTATPVNKMPPALVSNFIVVVE